PTACGRRDGHSKRARVRREAQLRPGCPAAAPTLQPTLERRERVDAERGGKRRSSRRGVSGRRAMNEEATVDDRGRYPPAIAPWLLHLRFALEVGSLIALGGWARRTAGRGLVGWAAALATALIVAVLWGTFAVRGDPSRSGRAPVPVPGWLRIALEMAVFF